MFPNVLRGCWCISKGFDALQEVSDRFQVVLKYLKAFQEVKRRFKKRGCSKVLGNFSKF